MRDEQQEREERLQQLKRMRDLSAGRGAKRRPGSPRPNWSGESAALYCRISHVKDMDQTGVDRQERICREVAERLGLEVAPEHVFIDNNRSAWQRKRKRKGWDSLLTAAQDAGIKHIIAYHPDRLMRQPRDLEELLLIAEGRDITLHGQANQRDLSDPDDRFFLRIEVAHACRSSDDTSRRLKDAYFDEATEGRPHGGVRRYGYSKDGSDIVEEEAAIIREIVSRYLKGESPGAIAGSLNQRKIPTAKNKNWWAATVLAVLDSKHAAAIQVFRGEEIGRGQWPAIIDEGRFREVQKLRTFRAARETPTPSGRYYLLRGIITCGKSVTGMAGAHNRYDGRTNYVCNRRSHPGDDKCARSIDANKVEAFVSDAAVRLLEVLTVENDTPKASLGSEAEEAVEAEKKELDDLMAAWKAKRLSLTEYQEMRDEVLARIAALTKRTVVRPAPDIIQDFTGPEARKKWDALTAAGDFSRQNAILRFLFAAVVINESTSPSGTFDYGRIDIQQNPI